MPKDNSTDSYFEDEVLSPNYFSLDFYQKRKHGKYRLVKAPKLDAVADTHCHIEMLARPSWSFIRCAYHNVTKVFCVIDSVDDGIDGIKLVEDAYAKAKEELPKIEVNKTSSDIVTITKDEKPELCLDTDSITTNPKIPDLYFLIGCHPHYAKDFNDNIYELLKHPKCRAVGEIGLDFHYDLSPRDTQIKIFKKQLNIAKEYNLPVSLHIREAHDVAYDLINFNENKILLHCFNLGPKELKPWVDAGCYIALGGPVTFKKSVETREALKYIPEDRLVVETDAPFMTPEPLRGDTCFPDHVIFTANILGRNLDTIMNNTKEFFCVD